MNVTIDPYSGFCFGVDHAVIIAERELEKSGSLFCLGEIVHNHEEVARLEKMGLQIIDHERFENLKDCTVMIRAHGEPPETYRIALENNILLVDATCPVVSHLQKKIRKASLEMEGKKGQVVIYGKEGHAEVRGLIGQTNGEVIIVGEIADLDRIDYSRPVHLFSQTTMSADGFEQIVSRIREKRMMVPLQDNDEFTVSNSICRQVSGRSAHLQEFASRFDKVIFVSGRKSSNGLILFDICKNANPESYLVSGKQELESKWFQQSENIGVCGATSTPVWLMEEVKDEILRIGKKQ